MKKIILIIMAVLLVGYSADAQGKRKKRAKIDTTVIVSGDESQSLGIMKVEKNKSTRSISTLKTKHDRTVSSFSDIFDYLQGRVPGLSVQMVNGEKCFIIRGGDAQIIPALVLVNGVETDPSLINPMEVESYDVIKDASAASLYGLRGAGGVLAITTKTSASEDIDEQ